MAYFVLHVDNIVLNVTRITFTDLKLQVVMY